MPCMNYFETRNRNSGGGGVGGWGGEADAIPDRQQLLCTEIKSGFV